MTDIKICCMASVEEAKLAIGLGANAIGLVSRMPSGPGPIEEALIAEIVSAVGDSVETFLLTCETTADAIVAQQRRTSVSTLQLVDAVERRAHEKIRAALDGVRIVQVIHVTGEDSIGDAVEAAGTADALLLDSGNPSLAVKELGGTGRRHDWSVSRRIVEASTVPVYLAGGLNASNVREAIETVNPFGVDVCSGVRTNGKLDREKLEPFLAAVRAADSGLGHRQPVTGNR
jgi:phosphoribosylanthranilate isomerase